MLSRGFVSPFHSISVPDPEKKGRVARKIPKTSLPLLSLDLIYVIVPHPRRKKFSLVLRPGKILEVRTPLSYTSADMLTYEKYIISNQEWISRVYEEYQNQEKNSPGSLSETFVSPFHSVSVPDPEKKGRVAREIPKTSLPLLSTDLLYVIVPHASRKNFSIALKPGKILEVRTPLSYSSADMLTYEKYIVSNQEWICRISEKYQSQEKNSPESLSETFPERDYILYLGMKYPFHIQLHSASDQTWVALEQNHCFEFRTSKNDSKDLRTALSTWYHKRAEEILPPLVEKYATIMKLPIPELIYNCAKSRWAVCYPRRNQIRFNILILKTPPDCIEYLVVHELSHLYVSGHNKEFWKTVSSYMPDYDIRRKKLAKYRTVL